MIVIKENKLLQVSEAISIGAQVIKENRIGVEEVQHCMEELEESINLQKQVEMALGNIFSLPT